MEAVLARFGERVREARLAAGLTEEGLAQASGLATVQISRIERGRREIRLTTIIRLLRALDVDPNTLLGDL